MRYSPRMRRARAVGLLMLSASFGLAGCGSSKSGGSNGAAGGKTSISLGDGGKVNGSAGSSSSAGTSIGINAGTSNSGAGGDSSQSCVEAKQEAKLAPLDLFVMLDISGSMLDPTSTRANAPTKWEAVSSALKSFLSDPASNGLGVGIQYFPLRDSSVPDVCTADSQCGTHGPCFLKFCQGADGYHACSRDSECVTVDNEDVGPCVPLSFCYPLMNGELLACHDDFECGARQTCEPYNECSGDRSYVCTQPGQSCRTQQGMDFGTCTAPESVCVHPTSCNASQYAAPAAPIAALPGNLNTLLTSIDGQMPDGQTPTAPALKGAIQAATSWAQAHPDHSVVVLLATAGLPTECVTNPATDTMGISEVRQAASAGVSANPSVLTFVIGVFGPADTEAHMNLDQIAMAGGTKTAFLVDTSADVSAQFQMALNEIRGSHLSCEYSVPAAPQGQSLDYNKVNVDFTNAGSTQRIAQVKDAAACGNADGWYYDSDPSVAAPTRILICPSACDRLQNATMGAVQVALGCATVVR